jgi:hypothetical protein
MDLTGDRNLGLLFRGAFDTGVLALHTGIGDLQYGGELYRGAGQVIGIGSASSSVQDGKSGLTVTLSGVSDEIIAYAEVEEFQRRRITIYLAEFDSAGALIDAEIFFDGLADDIQSNDDPAKPVVTLACEQRAFDLRRPRPFKYLPEDQKRRFPGDTFFDLVAAIQNRDEVWGRA